MIKRKPLDAQVLVITGASSGIGLADRLLAAVVPSLSRSSHPLTSTDNLETPGGPSDVHYPYFRGLPFSPYRTAQKNPLKVLAGAALLGLFLTRRRFRQ